MALDVKEGIPLASLTTFGIGGKAKFFIEVGSTDELTEAVKFTKDNKLAVFVLGGGSNILISDNGFDGVVIKMSIKGMRHDMSNNGHVVSIFAGAGEIWDDVVSQAVNLGAGGIENLSLIPGTVGGAVYQNIGAYGVEIKDVIKSIKIYDLKTGNIMQLSNAECDFEYRSSIFKKNKNLVILGAELLLSSCMIPNLSYPDLQRRFKGQSQVGLGQSPTMNQVRQAVIEIRRSKIPYPDEVGNAGSFFKNPVVSLRQFNDLKRKYPDLRGNPVRSKTSAEGGSSADHAFKAGRTSNGIKLSAAQLIEKASWKGKRLGNVGVSEKHALVFVNYGRGRSKDLDVLENRVASDVYAKFSVKLASEVEKIGPPCKII